ncbi:recombinase family protein [Salmonella enterica]|nr:recombinase family protein [Salmonella enterica]EHL2887000.1 recombinase family protein [Salmonella enterica]
MIYGYARCSTNESKQDINRQIRELKEKGAEIIYKEYESGTKCDRMELNKLLNVITEGDTIIVTEVSRITRSTKQLCDIIELAKERKIKLIMDSFEVNCIDKLDVMTEGMLKMMGVFAEMERNMISERVKSGLNNAKSKGKVLGRPKITKEDIPKNVLKNIELYFNKSITKEACAMISGISRPTLNKYIKLIKEGEQIKEGKQK